MRQACGGLFLACSVMGGAGVVQASDETTDRIRIAAADGPTSTEVIMPGLKDPVEVIRDSDGIVHIFANHSDDLYLAQGWVHARDRLFQMDVLRRQASGTLAELLGPSVLADDVEARTIGLTRAAERSLAALSPAARQILDRYAQGVNAWIAANPLPPEYPALEIETISPWTPLDSAVAAKGLTFNLSFDLDDIRRTQTLLAYQRKGEEVGFDGRALFFEDLFRFAPMTAASTVTAQASSGQSKASLTQPDRSWQAALSLDEDGVATAQRYLERTRETAILGPFSSPNRNLNGSNAWVIGGELSRSGAPLVANDPHLALRTPTIFYPIHLSAHSGRLDTIGASFAGIPFVIVGNNRDLAWTTTTNPIDVTDVYQEQLVQDPASPSGLSTVFEGVREPVLAIPEAYQVNVIGDGVVDNLAAAPPDRVPAATLVVPRRSYGPIVSRDTENGTAISVQWTGFSPTRELDAFRLINHAKTLSSFRRALRFFDAGSQNFMVGTRSGDIGFIASSEIPIREDLQAGEVKGAPPFLIRSGRGGNEWGSLDDVPDDQAVAHQIIPAHEMPQALNPKSGFLVNANNDPLGLALDNDPLNQHRPHGGIFYIGSQFALGLRAQRITDLIEESVAARSEGLDTTDMQRIQADVTLQDAIIMAPAIQDAYRAATADGAPVMLAAAAAATGVTEAVARLSVWDYSTPTGILDGYDAADVDGELGHPTAEEGEHSIAAMIYAVWRSRMIANTVDRVTEALAIPSPGNRQAVSAIANLLSNQGIGASGIDFFEHVDAHDAATRRDIAVLVSLKEGLDLLASDAFAPAFANSSDQAHYQWGKAHRLILNHPLGDPFSLTSPGNVLGPSLPGLPGAAMDGGFETVDDIGHNVRIDAIADLEADHGPTQRYVATVGPSVITASNSLPGGASGTLGHPFAANLARAWATNDTYPLRSDRRAVDEAAVETVILVP